MSSCCSCKTRYKRLVDAVFPAIGEASDEAKLQHLTWYAASEPRKLPKIGRYLARRTIAGIRRQREAVARIGTEAFNALLQAAHSELKLFVDAYFSVLRELLESRSPTLQQTAVTSIDKFANIKEDTPSYVRHHDFFVTVLSALAWSSETQNDVETRAVGLLGLRAVLRKHMDSRGTVHVWERHHIQMMVPALLYNMRSSEIQDNKETSPEPSLSEVQQRATSVLKELIRQVSFGDLKTVLEPVYVFISSFELWTDGPDGFGGKVVLLLLDTISRQFSAFALEELVRHLQMTRDLSLVQRRGLVTVIAVSSSRDRNNVAGFSITGTFSAFLKQLQAGTSEDETALNEAVVQACGDMAGLLPPAQKTDVMTYIVCRAEEHHEAELVRQALRCLRQVAAGYEVQSLKVSMPLALLDPLLKLCVSRSAPVRGEAIHVLYNLLKCPLEETELEGTAALPRAGSSYLSAIVDTLRLVMPDRSSSSLSSLQGGNARGLQATRRNCVFIKGVLNKLLWVLYEVVRLAETAEDPALHGAGQVAVLLATVFGATVCAKTLQVCLALQDAPAKPDAVRLAFLAVLLKRMANVRNLETLRDYVDKAVDRRQHVLTAAIKMGSRDLAKPRANSSDEADEPIFRSENVARLLTECGFPEEQIATVTFGYEHSTSLDDALGASDHPTTFLRPVIKAESVGTLSLVASREDEDSITFESLRKVVGKVYTDASALATPASLEMQALRILETASSFASLGSPEERASVLANILSGDANVAEDGTQAAYQAAAVSNCDLLSDDWRSPLEPVFAY